MLEIVTVLFKNYGVRAFRSKPTLVNFTRTADKF